MASTYGTVRYKDKGDSVKALQTALNSAGYNLDVDGIFGKNTLNAVKSYQKANGLTVDGIVGNNTWGALNRASQNASIGSQTGATPQDGQTTNTSSGTATEPATGTGSGLSEALEKLIAQYNATPGYTPKTDEEIRKQAEGEYQSYYDQLKLAAQQQHQQSDLSLQQQREGLEATYDKQREQSAKAYAQNYSQADRQMLSRGMQRSSYGAQTLANIFQQGAEAQQAIGDQQAAAEANIDQQRTQLAQQLAQQLSQYSASEAADVLARIRELEDKEYERGMTATEYKNSLAGQIYQYMYQAEQDKISQQQWQQQFDYQKEQDRISQEQWQQQFDESVRQFNESQKKSSSSGNSSKKPTTTTTGTDTTTSGGMTWSQFMSSLGASGKTSSIPVGVVGAVAGTAGTVAGALSAAAAAAKKNTTTTTTVKDSAKKKTSIGGNKFTTVSQK